MSVDTTNKSYIITSLFKEEKVDFKTINAKEIKNENRFLEFETLCKYSQKGMAKYLTRELKNLYGEDNIIKVNNSYIIAKGEVPVMLVAHMDTVHASVPKTVLYSKDYNLITSPEGIGGDDRCGIYAIMEIIKSQKCYVMFCYDEEMGCVGADNFSGHVAKSDSLKAVFDDIKFIIEIDRRGSNDSVYYDLDNTEFETFITEKSNGYFKTNYGSCSDISYIAPALGKAAVNLSSGYYNEHHKNEYVNIKELKKTIEHVKLIISSAMELEKPFEYKEIERYCYWPDNGLTDYYRNKYGYYGYDWDDDWDYYKKYNQSSNSSSTSYRGEEEWEIVFVDTDGASAVDYLFADSEDAAVGKFMKAHEKVCFEDIYYVDIASNCDAGVDRYYFDGEECTFDDTDEKQYKS